MSIYGDSINFATRDNGKAIAALASLAFVAVATGCGAATQAEEKATSITVRAGESGPRISRDIFGQFAEHLGTGVYGGVWVGPDSPIPNVRGVRTDVVEALRALNVPNVRWPGGCYADNYHWRNGVGPQRHSTVNSDWGGVADTNEFGTDEFFDFLGQIGADAYVSVNIGTGTPREAAEWLEYMTVPQPASFAQERSANGHEAPYEVPIIGLGNESWSCGGPMTAEEYVAEMKRYARFSRNLDPNQTGEKAMRRIAVGPGFPGTDWTEAVMQAWKNRDWSWSIEGFSIHNYTIGGWPPRYRSDQFGEDDYAALVAETLKMDQFIAQQTEVMDRYDPEKEISLFVDEWGVWLAPLPDTNPGFLAQQNSMRDAIIAALNLNIFARHAERVRGANIAQMVNVLQAMILTDGPKMVLTPTYHVFHMYLPFQDASFVPIDYNAGVYSKGDAVMPRLDAIAARDKNGTLWFAVANIDPEQSASLQIKVNGESIASASGEVLTAPAVDSHNTFDQPDAVRPRPISAGTSSGVLTLEVPGKSVAVVKLVAQ